MALTPREETIVKLMIAETAAKMRLINARDTAAQSSQGLQTALTNASNALKAHNYE